LILVAAALDPVAMPLRGTRESTLASGIWLRNRALSSRVAASRSSVEPPRIASTSASNS
jgi:hypothetical protein